METIQSSRAESAWAGAVRANLLLELELLGELGDAKGRRKQNEVRKE